MPKKSKRTGNKSSRMEGSGAACGGGGASDDNDSIPFNDNVSVASLTSSGSLARLDEMAGGGGGSDPSADAAEELSQEELFEDKLREAIDLATQKSANGRAAALQAIAKAFVKKYTPEFVEDRRLTLTDVIERALRKGKCAEQVAAANLAVLVCLQLGPTDAAEDTYKELKSTFLTMMADPTGNAKVRAAVATALGSCCFLAGGEMEECVTLMESFEKVFSRSYTTSRGGGGSPSAHASQPQQEHGSDVLALHTAALSAWTLLLTLLPPAKAFAISQSHLSYLCGLLDSSDVELRIAAGEAIAILFEDAWAHDEDAMCDAAEEIAPKLQELSKDSHKYRSKKDRKEQRSSIRDVLRTVEDGESYFERLKINARESLEIDSWDKKRQYDALCKSLSSGMNLHLTENELVREVFELGPVVPLGTANENNKPSKHERLQAHNAAFKCRTQTRLKNRDKRSAANI